MPPPPRAGIGAAEALEGVIEELGRESGALSSTWSSSRAPPRSALRRDLALAVVERVLDQVGERLLQAQAVALDREPVGRLDDQRPARTPRREPRIARAIVAEQTSPTPIGCRSSASLPCSERASDQQVLRPAAISRSTSTTAEAIAARSSSGVFAVAQRQLELGLVQRERRAQLVARVVDEGALALQGGLEPGEHLVQGLAEPAELVVGLRQRQALIGLGRRDLRGAAAHRLDRAQRGAGRPQ